MFSFDVCNTHLKYWHFSLTVLFSIGFTAFVQSPHGKSMVIDCASCHSPDSWTYNKQSASFDHDRQTGFALWGQHKSLECLSCHKSLNFAEVQAACISCHTDFHQQTVGNDCARCHTSKSWIVEDLTLMHERTSFPLMGVHAGQDCAACHQDASLVNFKPTGVTCLDCHRVEYLNAKTPDHVTNQFSTDCSVCHQLTGNGWMNGQILHSFFPLEQSHGGLDCTACHQPNTFKGLDANCISCHAEAINPAQSIDHSSFPNDCKLCHNLAPGWKPASFSIHDSYFPIYSGEHKGKWNECTDCHMQSGNYKSFSCIDCHEHNNAQEMAKEHDDVSGFKFESQSCFGCHPRGD